MAWFKKQDGDAAANTPAPVTIERVGAYFDRAGWSYDIEDNRLSSGFVGYYTTIRLVHDQFLTITVTFVPVPLPLDKVEELQEWADERNRDGSIGTVQVHVDDEDGTLMVISDHSLVANRGATDAQLEAWVDAGIAAQLGHMAALEDAYGVKPPSPEFSDD